MCYEYKKTLYKIRFFVNILTFLRTTQLLSEFSLFAVYYFIILQVEQKMASKQKFSKATFQLLGLPDLLINVRSYADYTDNEIFLRYQQWCVEAAFEKWSENYLDFDYVIDNLKKQNKKFYDFGRISCQDKNVIYRIIWKKKL